MVSFTAVSLIPVRDREIQILNYLRALPPDSAKSVREIWEAVSQILKDTVTVQAYHKIIDRLFATGQIEEAGDDVALGKLYRLAPYLHVSNPATLDDIHEWIMASMPPSEILAKAMTATDYLDEMKDTTLRRAAVALLDEDPVKLFYDMLLFYLTALEKDLNTYNHLHPSTLKPELRDLQLKNRIWNEYHDLDLLLYRDLSIPLNIVDITDVVQIEKGLPAQISYAKDALEEILRQRVFGESFLMKTDVSAVRGTAVAQRVSVAGTDGSTHSGILSIHTARAFSEEHGVLITFNNAMAYVVEPELSRGRITYPFHSVPMTRSALDDPNNRGMVLAPMMFPDLDEGAYEHMAHTATDVVQWRVDAAVFSGRARALSPEGVLSLQHGMLLPAPTVQIRDGSVMPFEREFRHYEIMNAYGDFAREGIALSNEILQRVTSQRSESIRVFAGAVKTTRLRIFSRVLNWYITEGSKKRFGEPIDATWDVRHASLLSDNEAMTYLLNVLSDSQDIKDGIFYVTCVVVRQFHSLTEHYRPHLGLGSTDEDRWIKYFEHLRERKLDHNKTLGGPPTYLDTVEIADDPYIQMCARADYGMFYIGHTDSEPPPLIPRYEFLDSLRGMSPEKASERVQRNVERILLALDHTGLQIDKDHNFMSRKQIVKIIPEVIFTAHEHGKALGHRLESELKSWVVARLQEMRKTRGLKPGDVDLLPVPIKTYLEKHLKALTDDLREENKQIR